VPKIHIRVLKKFYILGGQVIKDSTKIRGEKGKAKIPADSIVPEPHYLHNLVRGVYKPDNDNFALSIQLNPRSKWGTEIDFETRKWKIDYDFGDEKKYSRDIASLRKCYENGVPIGIIYKHKKGVNEILGLGRIANAKRTKFQIIPYEIDERQETIEYYANTYAKDRAERKDFSSEGNERTVLSRALTRFFRDQLLSEYDGKCAFCGFGIEYYLVAAHVVPFSRMQRVDPKNAMNPSDGLLLCKLCDSAFEGGDICVRKDRSILILEQNLISRAQKDPAVKSWISIIREKIPIKNDSRYPLSEKYLQEGGDIRIQFGGNYIDWKSWNDRIKHN